MAKYSPSLNKAQSPNPSTTRKKKKGNHHPATELVRAVQGRLNKESPSPAEHKAKGVPSKNKDHNYHNYFLIRFLPSKKERQGSLAQPGPPRVTAAPLPFCKSCSSSALASGVSARRRAMAGLGWTPRSDEDPTCSSVVGQL